MDKLDLAIQALAALPEERRDEVAELILEIAGSMNESLGTSVLSADEQLEVRRRHAGFVPGNPDRLARLVAELERLPKPPSIGRRR